MSSTIFFNDLTVIDYSMIDINGAIVGGSALLCLEVSGDIESKEGVVIDFSAGKKKIKALIDGAGGFDHTCWVNIKDPNIIYTADLTRVTVTHAISKLSITAEPNAFSFIKDFNGTDCIEHFLNERLAADGLKVSKVTLKGNSTDTIPVPTANTRTYPFRYVHGLKYSSSHGCKNIAHGHLSYLQAVTLNPNHAMVDYKLKEIADVLDRTVFVHEEDLKSFGTQPYVVSYTTDERGPMEMTFLQKMVVLQTQTTVEHLVEYVAARWYNDFKAVGITQIYVSEGLCKGAKVTIGEE